MFFSRFQEASNQQNCSNAMKARYILLSDGFSQYQECLEKLNESTKVYFSEDVFSVIELKNLVNVLIDLDKSLKGFKTYFSKNNLKDLF